MTAEPTAVAYRRVHNRMVMMIVIAIAPLSLVLITMVAHSWWDAIIIGIGILATFLMLTQGGTASTHRYAIYALAATTTVWVVCATLGLNPFAFFGLGLAGGLYVTTIETRRITTAVCLGIAVAAMGALYFASRPITWDDAISYVVLPAGLTIFMIGVVFIIERSRVILRNLEQAQQSEFDLAILRERMRFASELHDIQGHILHVVKLKTAVAEELLRVDPDRTARELRDVSALIADAITQTKQLAYAQRKLNAVTELENSKNLFEAAGIKIRVSRAMSEGVPSVRGELLGQVIREATTNILRHAQATYVTIGITDSRVDVINDGAADGQELNLSGLEILRQRVREAGGELTISSRGRVFTTSATFEEQVPKDREFASGTVIASSGSEDGRQGGIA